MARGASWYTATTIIVDPAEWADLKLEKLVFGLVHWEFFKQHQEDLETMQRAIRYLRSITVNFTARIPEDGEEEDFQQIPECKRYLETSGRMKAFMTASPNLEYLEVTFDWEYPCHPANLNRIVGDFTWHNLKTACFSFIEADEDDLTQFYSRHAGTLRNVGLASVKLTSGGD